MTYCKVKAPIEDDNTSTLFTFAYDDGYSIEYFGKRLKSLWNQNGTSIQQEIVRAFSEYQDIIARCDAFDKQLHSDAVKAGGEEYAELLNLTYRQAIAAHKMVVDENGEIL